VLRSFGGSKPVTISGYSWQKRGESKAIGTGQLVSKILCERHNAALSTLDGVAGRFFDYLDRINDEWTIGDKANHGLLFNGHDLERWILKTLCGYGVSGILANQGGVRLKGWNPPKHWVRLLFGLENWKPQCGLYYLIGQPEDVRRTESHIQVRGVFGSDAEIAELAISLLSFLFILMMEPFSPDEHDIQDNIVFRPEQLWFVDGNCLKTLVIRWNERGDKGITIQKRAVDV
jgi:hypothetical protein